MTKSGAESGSAAWEGNKYLLRGAYRTRRTEWIKKERNGLHLVNNRWKERW